MLSPLLETQSQGISHFRTPVYFLADEIIHGFADYSHVSENTKMLQVPSSCVVTKPAAFSQLKINASREPVCKNCVFRLGIFTADIE